MNMPIKACSHYENLTEASFNIAGGKDTAKAIFTKA